MVLIFNYLFRNLQAAIGAYYDYEQPTTKMPCCGLVGDVTIGEGESVSPSTQFVKTWRVRNSGIIKKCVLHDICSTP